MATEAQAEAPKVVSEAEELPKAIVRRAVKDKLSQCSDDGSDIALHRDALLAFSESGRIFIHYLSATANDICRESKRQTISADDVLKALEEMEFPEFIEPLRASLDDFRRKNAEKKAVSPNAKGKNKRKREEGTSQTKDNGKRKKEEEAPQEKDNGERKKEEETSQTKDSGERKEEETSQAKDSGERKEEEASQAKDSGGEKKDGSNDDPLEDGIGGGQ